MTRADCVVVGSGLAGLMTALDLEPLSVVLVTRGALGDFTSSAWAQGGVAAALGDDDSPELHAVDTIAAGAGLVDATLARDLAQEAPQAIGRMIALGARLDRSPDGRLSAGREAAHSRRRIVHANGDATGAELVRTAIAAVREAQHIAVREDTTLTDILRAGDGGACGVRCIARDGDREDIVAPRVVVATGGLGALYRFSTNPPGQWGAGIAVAERAGALLADLEFVQFHPTALDAGIDPLPLVSEAVRGEGATLVDDRGIALMEGVDARGDLATRDIVARAVYRAMRSGRRVYLDARARPGSSFPARFPRVFAACCAVGIDPRREPIPVAAAAHYHMGGIAVDERGRTTVPGLWACGEVSATGLHGANRLASNSLLEALVFARRVARDAAATVLSPAQPAGAPVRALPYALSSDDGAVDLIRSRMFSDVGIERDGAPLRAAAVHLHDIAEHAASQRVRDMATVGRLIAEAAERRRESRGSHFRIDYPDASPSARRSFTAFRRPPRTRVSA